MEATDDLPVEVLTELGRVTWAAIVLEDSAKWLCSSIQPVNPHTDRRVITKKIDEALGVLKGWPDSSERDNAQTWLRRARQVLDARNAILHATPLAWVGELPDGHSVRHMLGEMPQKGRPYYERPMSVDSLSQLHGLLAEAKAGWREAMLGVAELQHSDDASRSSGKAEPS